MFPTWPHIEQSGERYDLLSVAGSKSRWRPAVSATSFCASSVSSGAGASARIGKTAAARPDIRWLVKEPS
jgi:hypothetical protein